MPPKKQYIAKLHEDQEVSDLFLVHVKQLTAGRTGKNYLRLTIGDRTGKMEARVWNGAEELNQRFNQGALVYVTGVVTSFQGVLQIKATYVEELESGKTVDWAEFLPSAERPAAEMWQELSGYLDSVQNPHIRRLLGAFTKDAELMEGLKRAPAAIAMHHAYLSGLLEHTLGVVRLADTIAGLYPVNRDLLLAGAFLHDVGKLRELEYTSSFDYTDEGRLIGHLVIGMTMIREKCAGLEGIPRGLQTHLEHMILSHHGELAWGSPKRPKTLEALVLHVIDNLDAKLSSADRSMREVEDGADGWTGYLKMFDRPLVRTPDFSAPDASGKKAGSKPQTDEPEAPVQDEAQAAPVEGQQSIAAPERQQEQPEEPSPRPNPQGKLLI